MSLKHTTWSKSLIFTVFIGVFTAGCSIESVPTASTSSQVEITSTTSEISFRDPTVPVVGGSGLPDLSGTDEEVDCDNAEELCESGEWACDDIADYCDIGPDDGSELPDDWDWDE